MQTSFALVREVAGRSLGTPHYDVQLMGGWIMARGMLAEMATGEGKTLTATLPAAAAALAGIPVHVISSNDYLVTRDAEAMGPLYEALGLSVGTVTDAEKDPDARRAAYACDITYATSNQVAFDYLRDRIASQGSRGLAFQLDRLHREQPRSEQLLLRGLCFAIVDEADSVLIDEARTPLLLARQSGSVTSRSGSTSARCGWRAASKRASDFRSTRAQDGVELTPRGGSGSSRARAAARRESGAGRAAARSGCSARSPPCTSSSATSTTSCATTGSRSSTAHGPGLRRPLLGPGPAPADRAQGRLPRHAAQTRPWRGSATSSSSAATCGWPA